MNDVNASIGISNFEHVKNNLLGKHVENGNYFTENLKNIDDIDLLNYEGQVSSFLDIYVKSKQ